MDLGRAPYAEVWELQKGLVDARARGEVGDTVIVVEHEPVYTVGRRRDAMANLVAPGEVPVFEVERGGDVTWHGPGQVVVYPILLLPEGRRDLHAHLHRLEDLGITTCAAFGLEAGRDPRNTGVWVGGRKLASIGIACRRWVTWHGLALNVDPDLGWFERIRPCGFPAELMTSMREALGAPVDLEAARQELIRRVAGW